MDANQKTVLRILLAALAAGALPCLATDAPKNDQGFVLEAAQGGHAEVKAGQLARDQAASAEVQKFGEMMIRDHSRAGNELDQIAKSNNLVFPPDTDAEHQQMLDRLAAKQGGDFDRAYIEEMVASHRKMEKLLEKISKEAGNMQVKDWAKRNLPVVQGHLRQAEELKKNLR